MTQRDVRAEHAGGIVPLLLFQVLPWQRWELSHKCGTCSLAWGCAPGRDSVCRGAPGPLPIAEFTRWDGATGSAGGTGGTAPPIACPAPRSDWPAALVGEVPALATPLTGLQPPPCPAWPRSRRPPAPRSGRCTPRKPRYAGMARPPVPSSQKALLLELKGLQEEPVEGFRVGLVDEGDLYTWDVAIFGPPDTHYEGGYFKVSGGGSGGGSGRGGRWGSGGGEGRAGAVGECAACFGKEFWKE